MEKRIICIVEDDPTLQHLLKRCVIENWGYEARGYDEGISFLEALDHTVDLVLLDIMMPGKSGVEVLTEIKARFPELPVIMLSAQDSVSVALETLKLGATDYFCKPIDIPKLEASVRNALMAHKLAREVDRLRQAADERLHFDNIISSDGKMQDVFRFVEKVKDIAVSILIQGESGTGKELIARAIHYTGNRKDKPFIVVNCASIPRDLMESELFGHERGAFTGAAHRKIGKFEYANGGSIFLDEIGELDTALQAKLLRVVQYKEFDRVGGTEVLKSDVRIISATHKNLHDAVERKEFREDLYFRLASFPITIPPLRERPGDIILLAEHFVKHFSEQHGKAGLSLSKSALQLLYDYSWPGNVRELELAVERAVVLTDRGTITENELPLSIQMFAKEKKQGSGLKTTSREREAILPFEKIKEEAIKGALSVTGGNLVETARQLKIGRATLYRLMKKYGIRLP